MVQNDEERCSSRDVNLSHGQCLPAYYCYAGYDGNPVYYERSGRTDLALVSSPHSSGHQWAQADAVINLVV